MTGLHIIPANDEKQHVFGDDCECEPDVLYTDPETGLPLERRMIVHNSFDHREIVEVLTGTCATEEQHWEHWEVDYDPEYEAD